MHHLGKLLVVGEKSQQESFISQLSASISLQDITKLDAKTPLSFLSKTLEHNQQNHSISLSITISLLHAALQDVWLGVSKSNKHSRRSAWSIKRPRKKSNKPLASARHKLYRTAVGQLLWTIPVRPDICLAVTELSRSLQAPTQHDEQQLKQVLRYLKGTLHFMISLQPPRKRVIERASSIQIQACL